MINSKKIEQIARQVHDAIPKGLRNIGDNLENKILRILQAQFHRMNLVNREEFDLQTKILLRNREKLASIEKRLAILEDHLTKVKTTSNNKQAE
ncbi:ubiquinone biosynthesis accessory factor UbiK [Candidatus Profftia tarda]|uniref:Ubiquinone biosynthesis accessory factor UbiK n=1 Tax=Candidatus Profftia tarda TaxID=1177216 RepID=A0A8E4EZL1_9ENTR|nr:accessory factor UbiK family protein [Candidatus Profftia tarda]CAD6506999.1 Uncharacterized protein YqiC [Candidatus Profftia tarda]